MKIQKIKECLIDLIFCILVMGILISFVIVAKYITVENFPEQWEMFIEGLRNFFG